jgi:HemY protein
VKRLAGFLLRLVLVVALALWLADRPGTAHIVWHDYTIETSAAMLGLVAAALGFVFYLAFRLLRFVAHGPTYWKLSRKMKKLRHGHDCLTQGLISIAAGDAAEAGRLAVAARKSLGNTTLCQLLQAQSAQLAGDERTAKNIFRNLAQETESAVLGYRGLIMLERRNGNWAEVERLAGKLHHLRPDTPWLGLVRFDVMVQHRKWDEANLMLAQAATARLLNPALVRRQRAAVLIAASQDAMRLQQGDQALQFAEKAHKQTSDWLPAILNLAQRQADTGHMRAARRTVEKHWKSQPHPQLAVIYQSIGDSPLERYKQLEKLCRSTTDHAISQLALAEAALDADLWGEARRHLTSMLSQDKATQTAYRLLAKLERRENGDEFASQQWLMKSADALADATWLCDHCGGSHHHWQAACSHCNTFNMLTWRRPGSYHVSAAVYAPHNHDLGQIEWQDNFIT